MNKTVMTALARRTLTLLLAAALVFACACSKEPKRAEVTGAASSQAAASPAPAAQGSPSPSPAPLAQPSPSPSPSAQPEPEPAPKMIEYDIGPDGFSDCTPGSLPSRMEGVYRLQTNYSEEADWPDEYIELYEIFGNLYGFYSGWGYSAMEFFPVDGASYTASGPDNADFRVLTFSSMSNVGEYWSGGFPATRTLTLSGEGLQADAPGILKGGDCGIGSGEFYERMDEDMGHLDAFDYRSDGFSAAEAAPDACLPVHKLPKDLIGIWKVDSSDGYEPVIEFTPDGLVQVFEKHDGAEVMLYRGSYAVSEEKKDGFTQVYMLLMGFGWSAQPSFWELRLKPDENGGFECAAGSGDFGDDVFPAGSVLAPFEKSDLRVLTGADIAPADPSFLEGTYLSVHGEKLVIGGIGNFYYYETYESSGKMPNIQGSMEQTDEGYRLTAYDQETGKPSPFGDLIIYTYNAVQIEFASGTRTGTFAKDYEDKPVSIVGTWMIVDDNMSEASKLEITEDGKWIAYGLNTDSYIYSYYECTEGDLTHGTWEYGYSGPDSVIYYLLNGRTGEILTSGTLFYSPQNGNWSLVLGNGVIYTLFR